MRWINPKALLPAFFMFVVSVAHAFAQGKGHGKGGGNSGNGVGNGGGGYAAPEIDGPGGFAAIALLVGVGLIAYNRFRKR